MNRRIVIPLVALVAAGAAAAWYFDAPRRWFGAPAATRQLILYGNVDVREVQLAFRVAGRIDAMAVDEGDTVRTGQTLATLDDGPLAAAVRGAEAQVATRKAALDKAVAGPRPAEIDQAKAQYTQLEAGLKLAEQTLERAQRLLPTGSATQATVDQAQSTRDAAAGNLDSARQGLKLLEQGTRPEDIAAAEANLAEAEASLSSAKIALKDATLLAPADGVILTRVDEPGAVVAAGATAYVMALASPVWARAYVSEVDLGKVAPGTKVSIFTDSAPNKPYAGTIGYVSPVAEFTPKTVETPDLRTDLVYRVRIVVDRPDAALRQGMPVTITAPLGAAGDGGLS